MRRAVEKLKLPNGVEVSNDGRTLYLTCDRKVHAPRVAVRGAQFK